MRTIWRRVSAIGLAAAIGAAAFAPTTPAAAATDAEESCFITASYRLFWGTDPSFEAFSHWLIMFDSGEPYSVLPEFLANEEPWLGVTVDGLYQQALDRYPDTGGRAYRIDRLKAGVLVNALGSQIYGSNEFYERAGATPEGFVTSLYDRILFRAPDSSGLNHWVDILNSSSRGAVAAAFFASPESRADRVNFLYHSLLGRTPEPSGLNYWMNRLLTENDVRLAVLLASSSEFFARSTLPGGECLDPLTSE